MTAHLPHARSRLFAVLFCTLTLTACGPSQPEPTDYSEKGTPAKGDVYVSASLGDASVLLPWLASDQPSNTIGGMVFDSLLKYDKDLNLKGNLAETWEIAPDNLAITFYLRKDVKWSDDKPFSAYDVEATFNAITNPNTRTPYAGDYKIVKKLEVLDPLTLKVYYT
jgi:peptide/nickel transport system substrate-binding protein